MGTEDERQERFPMPKNKGKGGKSRRRGKGDNGLDKRELIFKEDGQEYAQVLTMLGGGRLEAQCFDGIKRLCGIRGKMRKRVWISKATSCWSVFAISKTRKLMSSSSKAPTRPETSRHTASSLRLPRLTSLTPWSSATMVMMSSSTLTRSMTSRAALDPWRLVVRTQSGRLATLKPSLALTAVC